MEINNFSNHIKIIDYKIAVEFLLPRHYSGRIPQITIAFGYYIDECLCAVCTFGKPASSSLCKGICGEENKHHVYELNRLCRIENIPFQLSHFVSKCLQYISKTKNWIIVSYADTEMFHNGYIYQACNFLYTGCTKQRTDKYTEGNKHPRHYNNAEQNNRRKIRSPKHRYVYFATKNKNLKKQWLEALKYKSKDYPKGENKNYILGTYLKAKIQEGKYSGNI